ncbi:MAG: dihydrofolate reductase [Patescibacteria group bacterium]|nr:dihydrofolate reductase [Patescibacteria group bacterium]
MAALVSLVVAHDDNLGIGKKSQLLFRISADLKRFKSLTMGHPIIMGRKTHESIGRVLPGRTNIIITRNPNFSVTGAQVVNSLAVALNLARSIDDQEVFIIGGGEIFKTAMESGLVDKLYVTKVKGDFGAEIFFPPYPTFNKIVYQESGQENDDHYQFLELVK